MKRLKLNDSAPGTSDHFSALLANISNKKVYDWGTHSEKDRYEWVTLYDAFGYQLNVTIKSVNKNIDTTYRVAL